MPVGVWGGWVVAFAMRASRSTDASAASSWLEENEKEDIRAAPIATPRVDTQARVAFNPAPLAAVKTARFESLQAAYCKRIHKEAPVRRFV